jgi:hypothetical protein
MAAGTKAVRAKLFFPTRIQPETSFFKKVKKMMCPANCDKLPFVSFSSAQINF